MRRLAFIPLALLCVGAAGPPAAQPRATGAPPEIDRMNQMPGQPACVSIPRQVSGEDRRYEGTRLDRQPPGRLILAVQREVKGCPEVVFADQQRRNVRPIFPK